MNTPLVSCPALMIEKHGFYDRDLKKIASLAPRESTKIDLTRSEKRSKRLLYEETS